MNWGTVTSGTRLGPLLIVWLTVKSGASHSFSSHWCLELLIDLRKTLNLCYRFITGSSTQEMPNQGCEKEWPFSADTLPEPRCSQPVHCGTLVIGDRPNNQRTRYRAEDPNPPVSWLIPITKNPTLYPDTSHLISTPKESAPQFPRVSKKTYIKSQRPSSAARHTPLTCHIWNDKGLGSCASETGNRGHLCSPYMSHRYLDKKSVWHNSPSLYWLHFPGSLI